MKILWEPWWFSPEFEPKNKFLSPLESLPALLPIAIVPPQIFSGTVPPSTLSKYPLDPLPALFPINTELSNFLSVLFPALFPIATVLASLAIAFGPIAIESTPVAPSEL